MRQAITVTSEAVVLQNAAEAGMRFVHSAAIVGRNRPAELSVKPNWRMSMMSRIFQARSRPNPPAPSEASVPIRSIAAGGKSGRR